MSRTEPTPVWLLDVDGVLNAIRPGWGAPPRTARAWANKAPYRLRWAPELISRVWALHRTGTVEIRWATTWVDYISEIEHRMRLPHFEVAFTGVTQVSLDADQVTAQKLDAALHVVRHEHRPLIWTDDHAIPRSGLDRAALDGSGALLIAPASNRGLQPEHLEAIETFAASPRAWSSAA